MGWSQGGYISAFLTTHDSARFKAVSVGAGISNWMTYYVNTDIHPFTRQYLKATPWDDPKIYAKTSPMTYIKQAKAPTLIQHGELDKRVPIPNAYELYQGLQDQGVPGEAHRLQGLRPRPDQAEGAPRGDGAQPGVVREVHLGRGPGAARPEGGREGRALRGHHQLRAGSTTRSRAPGRSRPRRPPS